MLLTADEEVVLARRARTGDLAARNELVLRNRSYLLNRMRRYSAVCKHDDLLQAGYVGLVEAANIFDPDAHPGTRFLAIAKHYVHMEMTLYLYSRQLVRIPLSMRRPEGGPRTGPVRQRNRQWSVACAAVASRPTLHLGQSGIAGGSQVRLLADPCQDEHSRAETVEMVTAALDRLPLLHKDLLRRRFGIGVPRQTVRSIAREFGTSHQTVFNIQRHAMAELRAAIA